MDKIAPEFDRVAHQYRKQIYSISSLAGAREGHPGSNVATAPTTPALRQASTKYSCRSCMRRSLRLENAHVWIELKLAQAPDVHSRSARPKHSLPRPPLRRGENAVVPELLASYDA